MLFFLFDIYITYFIALRQILSLSFILWALIFVFENRKYCWLWFVVFSLIAYLFHTSAIFVVFCYLISYFIHIKSRVTIFLVIIASAILGIFSAKFSYLDVFAVILHSNIPFIDRVSNYLSDKYYTNEGSPLNIILRTTVIGLFVFSSIREDRLNHWFSKIYLFGIVFYNLFNSFPLISRANVAFIMMSLIVFTWVYEKRISKYYIGKRAIKYISIIIICYMLRSFILDSVDPDLSSSARLHPYYFFFDNYFNHPSIKRF